MVSPLTADAREGSAHVQGVPAHQQGADGVVRIGIPCRIDGVVGSDVNEVRRRPSTGIDVEIASDVPTTGAIGNGRIDAADDRSRKGRHQRSGRRVDGRPAPGGNLCPGEIATDVGGTICTHGNRVHGPVRHRHRTRWLRGTRRRRAGGRPSPTARGESITVMSTMREMPMPTGLFTRPPKRLSPSRLRSVQ